MLDIALLGTGGMMPLPNRFLTAMLCRHNGHLLLVDCGEGTQVTLKLLGWGFKDIDTIIFTHFHADHISGLPGLLLTIGNTGRTEPIQFFGPPGLSAVVRSLCVIAPELPFELLFHEWRPHRPNEAEIGDLLLRALPVNHGVSCFAYRIDLPRRGLFDPVRAREGGVPMAIWSTLQKQKAEEIVYEGKRYTRDMVLGPPRKGLAAAYCTDTRPVAALSDFVRGADLFICEGLHAEADRQEKTARHRHMMFSEAAAVARAAAVTTLWLTHFSPALVDPEAHLSAAASIFPQTRIGKDRMTMTLRFV